MILIALILGLFLAGVAAWLAGRANAMWARWVALAAMVAHLIVTVALWVQFLAQGGSSSPWYQEVNLSWIPQLGISLHLALDGLSLLLLLLTSFLGLMAVACSWQGIMERVGFFHFNLLWTLAAISGAFLALDLFLFYFFWEMMLIPLYFLIGIWGHENRVYATLKFFIFTQASGLLMLLAILGLYIAHGQSSGVYTFDYSQLLGTPLSASLAFWLMLGFFVAFAVKVPAVPVHTWLPDAHTEAPTAGSVVLAGLLLKAGAYGFLRFLVPLFPQAALDFAPVAMALGITGILYGAFQAFGQTDMKRMVAYTSVSHMGFVLLGIFAWNELALQGAVMIIIAHGLSTGALFILVGDLQDRMHTRDMRQMGGLWSVIPRYGGIGMFFAMASLGLPGLANFVGEFLVLVGVYRVSPLAAILATLGFIVSTVYALWMIQRAFWGENERGWKLPDANPREMAILLALAAVVTWFGLFPQPVFDTVRNALGTLMGHTNTAAKVAAPDDATGLAAEDGAVVAAIPPAGGSR